MTLVLELPPDVEARLRSIAQARGIAPEAMALEAVAGIADSPMSDFLAYSREADAKLEAMGFTGADGADLVREGREERAARILGVA